MAAANVLIGPLRAGRVEPEHLAAIQRRRALPTRVIQAFQAMIQKRLLAPALDPDTEFRLPFFLRLGIARWLLVRLVAFGIRRVRVES